MPDTDYIEIPAVANNREKYDAYQYNMGRFTRARKEGFYFEALLILYAMLEDRSTSFLYHIGFISGKKKGSVAETVKKDVREILALEAAGEQYGFGTLAGKLVAIGKVMDWAEAAGDLSGYQKEVRSLIAGRVKIEEVREALDKLKGWRQSRNQLVHSLFRTKDKEVEARLADLVTVGYEGARTLDNAARRIRRGAIIRKRYAIQ